MKLKHLLLAIPLLAGLAACDDFALLQENSRTGELRWILDKGFLTKASAEIPDTNDFILTIRDAAGTLLYEGAYGDSPEYLPVDEGSYTLRIVSVPFSSPAFDRPQYGDEKVVVVPAGKQVTAVLECKLTNAGIRLKIAPDFLTAFPDGVLFVKQDDTKLKYAYTEKRIAYMMPGPVSVILYNDARDETLMTRNLEAREILTVNISAPDPGQSGGVRIALDTTKVWSWEDYAIGGDPSGGNSGDGWQTALSVTEAASHAGEKNVWVYGYIVGGDLTSAGKNVKTGEISKSTHLALAERSSITAKASCVAVELPKGEIRAALNLVDHPDLIGSRVYVKGNLVDSYFGTIGLKGTCEYVLR